MQMKILGLRGTRRKVRPAQICRLVEAELTGILGAAIKVPQFDPRIPHFIGRRTQAGMLTSAGDSAGIGLVFAAALMESETTQLAPANAMQIALPAQLK